MSLHVERFLSRAADAVIANAEAAGRQAIAGGFPARNLFVIPNGFDCEAFAFDPEGRARVRAEWGIPADAEVVGMVARLDPVKDHETFLAAAARVVAKRPGVRFACVGGGSEERAAALARLARDLGLGDRVTFTGFRRATRAEYSAFDLGVLASNVRGAEPDRRRRVEAALEKPRRGRRGPHEPRASASAEVDGRGDRGRHAGERARVADGRGAGAAP